MRDIRYQIAINRQPDNALSEEAAEIEVQQTIEGPTTFRIKFAIDICQGEFNLLDDERLNPGDPDTEATVTAYLNGESYVMAHGIITERKVNIAEGGSGSSLEIMCQDRRLVMDREERNEAHQGRASDIAKQILERYGFEIDITDTEISYEEDTTTLNQSGNGSGVPGQAGRTQRLSFLDRLGSGRGAWRVSSLPRRRTSSRRRRAPPPTRLVSRRRCVLAPDSAAELKLNSGDGCSNVASFELQSNAETPNQSGPIERVDADSGEVTETEAPEADHRNAGRGSDGAGAAARRGDWLRRATQQEARVRTQAALNDASWSVQATAETSVQALNAFVSPHQIVKVTGAGQLNSGDYFVKAVTHTVDSSAHKMRIELLRNALGGF